MKVTRESIKDVVEIILGGGAIQATKYFSDILIVRARRRLFGGKITKGNVEIVLTIGKPNYAEREFIKLCKKAKEPFPVKKIQVKMLKVTK
jgi:hypothetical protein